MQYLIFLNDDEVEKLFNSVGFDYDENNIDEDMVSDAIHLIIENL